MVDSLSAIDLSTSQAAAVLDLLERAQIPPQPAFYRLLYDYVAGVRGLFATRVADILEAGEGAEDRLYAEFVEPYETRDMCDRSMERIVGRLAALDTMISRRAEASKQHSLSLDDARSCLADAQFDATLLREWVERVDETNRVIERANQGLVRELDAAMVELDATRAELARTRNDMLLDPLTGVANRGGVDRELSQRVETFGSTRQSFACALLDVDHFKSLNDTYGHQAGDEILRIFARGLVASTRQGDFVGRTGGDEFIVILPGATSATAAIAAEHIRSAIKDLDLATVLGAGTLGGITTSIGVAQFRPGDSLSDLVQRADQCMYESKKRGRNRVVCDADPGVASA